jgi:hypothetical protein
MTSASGLSSQQLPPLLSSLKPDPAEGLLARKLGGSPTLVAQGVPGCTQKVQAAAGEAGWLRQEVNRR